ncbi:MAG: hypothetical protein WBW71_16255, partial [Bacteroidota bacterium]
MKNLCLFVFCIHIAFSQGPSGTQMSSIPSYVIGDAFHSMELNNAINKITTYCDFIYNEYKVTQLTPSGATISSTERWGEGSWGRGRFSIYVDRFSIAGRLDLARYDLLWSEHPSGPNTYWGTHPYIYFTACMIQAYVHLYVFETDSSTKSSYQNKIVSGLQYLIDEQLGDGGYYQWHQREAQASPNLNDVTTKNLETAYDAGEAVRAMCEGYYFLKNIQGYNNPIFLAQIVASIRKAADFLLSHDDIDFPTNYKAFSILGLTSAFEITGDEKYLSRAITKYINEIQNYQDSNGAWFSPGNPANYHDAAPWYAGIILRSLADLYSVLPSTYDVSLSSNIKSQIYKTINHFLIPGMTNSGGARLDVEGRFWAYKMQASTDTIGRDYRYGVVPSNFIHGLYYVLKHNILTTPDDQYTVRKFLTNCVGVQVYDTNKD